MSLAEPFRLLRVAMLVSLAISLANPGAGAQNKKRPAQKKSATAVPAWTKIDCGDNVELRVSGSGGLQGGLLQTELRSATPLSDVAGTWDEKPVPFWQD